MSDIYQDLIMLPSWAKTRSRKFHEENPGQYRIDHDSFAVYYKEIIELIREGSSQGKWSIEYSPLGDIDTIMKITSELKRVGFNCTRILLPNGKLVIVISWL